MKKIVVVTGTRADYGKLKPIIKNIDNNPNFECHVFVCGMHLLEKYGSTYLEIINDNYKNVYVAYGLPVDSRMDINCGNTINHLAGYVAHLQPDLIIVHGDRVDALCGAIVGALNNIYVAHIEGGEVSGTIDESIRHSISKLSHYHFVANQIAKDRLIQMGEATERIYIIGSPDIDIMLSGNLVPIDIVKKHYEIPFQTYGLVLYHSITTDVETLDVRVNAFVDSLIASERDYVVIYPNNDTGTEIIISAYHKFKNNPHFRIYPSIRFEYFLTLLKHADFIIGNSSAGIREACVYGVPAIDVGDRQFSRYDIQKSKNIQHVTENTSEIANALKNINDFRRPSSEYGAGNSAELFCEIMQNPDFWRADVQKHFIDRLIN